MEKLILKRKEYIKVIEHCQNAKPDEACGIMAGIRDNKKGKVKKIYLMDNKDASPESYFMDPDQQFEVFKNMRENDFELISIFHSHPHTEARPSKKDIEMAYYPEAIYTIISLAEKKEKIRAYKIKNDNHQEIKVILEADKNG